VRPQAAARLPGAWAWSGLQLAWRFHTWFVRVVAAFPLSAPASSLIPSVSCRWCSPDAPFGGAAVVTRAQISHISEEQRSIDFLFWSLSGLKSEIAMAPLRLLGEKPSSFNRSLDDA